jgi:hypothetical protein
MAQPLSRLDNSPIISVLAYCLSSISMTIVNKYVVSGKGWNLSFFYLFIQVRSLIYALGAVLGSMPVYMCVYAKQISGRRINCDNNGMQTNGADQGTCAF